MSLFDEEMIRRVVPVVALAGLIGVGVIALRDRPSAAVELANAAQSPSNTARVIKVATADGQPGLTREDIGGIVREYLLANPELLLEIQSELERKTRLEQEKQAKVALQENAEALFRSPNDPVMGDPNGDVTVVEFFDYNCGFCRRAIPAIGQLIETDKKVKVVFKELPIFGQDSEEAARAAIAAAKQGKYWEMHRDLLEKPGRANKQKALTIARKLGLDVARLEADMDAKEVRATISSVQELATRMGIQGTPHFLIGSQTIPGAPQDLYEQITARVALVRKEGCKVC